jgi:hypothetical protein
MAYIGNTVQNQGFAPAIDYFNGNGVTVTFTLSRPIASVAQVIVAIDNVIQNPSSAFNVVGNSITFTSAPLSGTNNIWVEYTSLITTYQGISQDPTVIGDIRATGGYLAEGDFGNSFVDGAILDYVTGAGRVTVGELDDLIFYHGGTAGRSEMMKVSYAGNSTLVGGLNIGDTTSPGQRLQISNTSSSGFAAMRMAANSRSYDVGVGGSASGFQQNNWYVYDVTGAATRLSIDSGGRVTTPFQSSFSAYRDTPMSSGAIVVDGYIANFNVGSNFNASNGTFTAPISGVYLFGFSCIGQANSGGNDIFGQINGSNQPNYFTLRPVSANNTDSYAPLASFSGPVSLSANDTFRIYSGYQLYSDGNKWVKFFGYLLG